MMPIFVTRTGNRLTPNNQAKWNILVAPPTSMLGFIEATSPGMLGGTEHRMATAARQFYPTKKMVNHMTSPLF